jgi:uncharacterized protein YjbK
MLVPLNRCQYVDARSLQLRDAHRALRIRNLRPLQMETKTVATTMGRRMASIVTTCLRVKLGFSLL